MTAVQDEALALVKFDDKGLVPAIAQQHDTGEVLMMAWMNEQAVRATLDTGEAHYWSRSRGSLWHKGESSGQTQTLKDFRVDCDGDTVLLLVDQKGVACHTGRRSCFFRSVSPEGIKETEPVLVSPDRLYGG